MTGHFAKRLLPVVSERKSVLAPVSCSDAAEQICLSPAEAPNSLDGETCGVQTIANTNIPGVLTQSRALDQTLVHSTHRIRMLVTMALATAVLSSEEGLLLIVTETMAFKPKLEIHTTLYHRPH